MRIPMHSSVQILFRTAHSALSDRTERTPGRAPGLFLSGILLHGLLWLCLGVSPALSQSLPVGDPVESYLRLLQSDIDPASTPSMLIRPVETASWLADPGALSPHPWQNHPFFRSAVREPDRFDRIRDWELEYAVAAPRFTSTWNNRVPVGQNDGAMWQGRGTNLSTTLGAHLSWGALEMTIRPEFGHHANLEFELSPFRRWPFPMHPFGEPLARIDMPQRFGRHAFSWFHPGQSTIQLRQWGAALGVSTANIWSGPAVLNPLVLSNNAPGFFHAFLGTHRPVATPAGNLEGRVFWGTLYESDFFDSKPGNDRRMISGLLLNWSPSFAPGLHLGMQRVMHEYLEEGTFNFSKVTRIFRPYTQERYSRIWSSDGFTVSRHLPFRADFAEQYLTFFARWMVPQHGFEAWFEWGRNDPTHDWRNFLLEPVNTRAYVLGFQKRFNLPRSRWLSMTFEMTQLESLDSQGVFNYPVWYEHPVLRQGFTHRGQVIGAGIGPGSNSQFLRFNFYDRLGLAGLSFNRIVNNNDRLFRHINHIIEVQRFEFDLAHEDRRLRKLHDVELRYGVHLLAFLPWNFELQADLYRSSFLNRHNLFENDFYNTNLQFTLRYQLPGMIR